MKLINSFGTIYFDFLLDKDVDVCTQFCKKEFDYLKYSLKPFGTMITQMIPNLYPYGFDKFIQDFVLSKFSAVFSNLLVSSEFYQVAGKRSKYHMASLPGMQEIKVNLLFTTVGTKMNFTMTCDESIFDNP